MRERFLSFIQSHRLLMPGARVVAGYSGGADSTALIHLLKDCGFDVIGAHLHHGMRPEADEELKQCEQFCDFLEIPFLSGKADVPRMAQDLKIGVEEAGRVARDQFLRQAAFRTESQAIATGHTQDDHVETILFNLARGAGMQGASGIPPQAEGKIRPLLPFSRDETRRYCEERGFWFHDDPANEDVSFSRARIRHRVLPELRLAHPGADEHLVRFAGIVQEEDRFLNGAAAAALEQAEKPLNGELEFLTRDCEAAFVTPMLGGLPAVLFRRAIRLAARSLGASLDFDQVAAIESSVQEGGKGSVTAEGGQIVVEWDPETLTVRDLQPAETYRYPLTIPGETVGESFGWQFTAFEDTVKAAPARASLHTFINPSKVRGSLYFRTAQAGDTMSPLGFEGTRKLADLLSEAGLTKSARQRLPIVCDLTGPIWAPGVCLHERVRPEVGDRALSVTFGPIPGVGRIQ